MCVTLSPQVAECSLKAACVVKLVTTFLHARLLEMLVTVVVHLHLSATICPPEKDRRNVSMCVFARLRYESGGNG